MTRVLQKTICDHCGTILHGHKGTDMQQKQHINIKGKITGQNIPNKNGIGVHFLYVTNNDAEDLHFCNGQCLDDYITTKDSLFAGKREAQLRREASENY
jgi:hypothetical protein